MKKIPLDQAQPGMILAQKIVRDDGVLLCQKGAPLTEALLRLLRRLNFETVPIEVASSESPQERAERLARQAKQIEDRFARVRSDPILAELEKALLKKLHESEP